LIHFYKRYNMEETREAKNYDEMNFSIKIIALNSDVKSVFSYLPL